MEKAMVSAAEMLRKYRKENRSGFSFEEHTRRQCEQLNASAGDKPDYDCPVCHNKGSVFFVTEDNEICSKDCSCMAIRNSITRIRTSGLQRLMELYTLEKFRGDTPLQQKMKLCAQRFLNSSDGQWFFAGGQSGAGKSHICTAVSGELLRRGVAVRYMLWKDESTRIKAAVNDRIEYERMINPLKTVEVLYIDDLFKPVLDETGRRKQPTPGDIQLAFEIINARYISGRVTIISSEWTIEELQRIDPAVGGRIFQMAEKYCLSISPGREKNFRLKGSQ